MEEMLGTVRGLIVSGPGAVRPGDIWPKGVDGQWVKLDLRARDGEIWKMLRMEGLAEDGGIQEAFSPYCGRGWGATRKGRLDLETRWVSRARNVTNSSFPRP